MPQQQIVSLAEILGRELMTLPVLLHEVQSASWPSEVMLSPEDFFAVTFGQGVEREEDGTPYIYLAATKVRCKRARPDLLNLEDWRPPRILLAPPVGKIVRVE